MAMVARLSSAVAPVRVAQARGLRIQSGRPAGRSSVGIWPCGIYRKDPNRVTLITIVVRQAGNERKGDYLVLVALGAGNTNPNATRLEVKDVDELGARIAAIRIARDLVGEPLEDRHITEDAWKTALEKAAAE